MKGLPNTIARVMIARKRAGIPGVRAKNIVPAAAATNAVAIRTKGL
jgi:hypothetical protein